MFLLVNGIEDREGETKGGKDAVAEAVRVVDHVCSCLLGQSALRWVLVFRSRCGVLLSKVYSDGNATDDRVCFVFAVCWVWAARCGH